MLLEDLGDESADALPVEERRVCSTRSASCTEQHASVGQLLDGGCLDRRPAVLSAQIAALADGPNVPLPGDLGVRLRAAVPRLQELCVELASSPIPPTLVHGDLHAGNIMRTAGRFVTFDWTRRVRR